jgi:peptidoglycan/xylan/chitin deacetylase (PgdA/CDA1 family)
MPMPPRPSRFRWPEPFRAAAFISFDVDGEVGFAASGIDRLDNRPAVRSLTDYELAVGIPRILRWLDRLGISTTFFVPGRMAELYPEMVREICAAGHEIGHHGYRHLKPDRISPEEQLEEMRRPLGILQDLTGEPVAGYRTPGWAPSADTLRLAKAHGLRYDSSLQGHEQPYVTPEGLLELPGQWVLEDWELWGYLPFPGLEYPFVAPETAVSLWETHFRAIVEEGGLFTFVLHPWIAGRAGYSRVLTDMVARWQQEHPEVWWASGRDIYRHAEESGQLLISGTGANGSSFLSGEER